MPIYKFYRLVSKTEYKMVYIGHTTQPLYKRLGDHKKDYKGRRRYSSAILIDEVGLDNVEIILIHERELANLEEARREERRLLEEVRDYAVNKKLPISTPEEMNDAHNRQRRDVYYKNKEKALIRVKAYYEANKEKVKQTQEANKEKYNARKRAVYAMDTALRYLTTLFN